MNNKKYTPRVACYFENINHAYLCRNKLQATIAVSKITITPTKDKRTNEFMVECFSVKDQEAVLKFLEGFKLLKL